MSYGERWFALAAKIKSLQQAGELYARFMGYQTEDSYGAGRYLREQCGAIVVSLEEFRRDFANALLSLKKADGDFAAWRRSSFLE
jgi:hypothetical protein